MEDKPELQLPLVSHEHRFLLFGYQRDFLEVTRVLLSPHLLEDIMATLSEDGIFGPYVDVHHLEQGVCIVYFVIINRKWLGVACIPPLI